MFPAVLRGIRPLRPMTMKAKRGLKSCPLSSVRVGYPRSTHTESVSPSPSLSTSYLIVPDVPGTGSGKLAAKAGWSAPRGRRILDGESVANTFQSLVGTPGDNRFV